MCIRDRLERVGVFPFSPEEGTPAAKMTDRCEPEEAQRRADLILELQAGKMCIRDSNITE